MIRRLLVANRGEIARRIFTTCRRLGIQTVAVHSDVDTDEPHVIDADLAVHLSGNAPGRTYLNIAGIIEAAVRAGADAVHPGYGFLAENAEFAQAVIDAGLVWVGPQPKAIAAMGSKLDAKALLAEAGVPVLASWIDPREVSGFPVLVKASAGGGGRGMRIVADADGLVPALASAAREASVAFGDPAVFCERYVEGGRHIEIQIMADTHGRVVALGERECSIQRRHQKIIEESPSTAVDETLRATLCATAIATAQAVSYVGAGTVEFLLAPDGEFFFLEMNTRLQVEHPVTECVTGLDVVHLQLLVAEGEPLPFDQVPAPSGHAIEARLYAEDPAEGWLASSGRVHRFAVPTPPGVRVDSGVADGSTVSIHYDSMLAKVIAWAPTRTAAARLLATALAGTEVHGVATNRDLLVRVLRSAEFLDGATDTGFLDQHPEVFAPILAATDRRLAGLAAALAGVAVRRRNAAWAALSPLWRNVASQPAAVAYDAPAGPLAVTYHFDRTGVLAAWSAVDAEGATSSNDVDLEVLSYRSDEVVLRVDGVRRVVRVHGLAPTWYVDSPAGSVALVERPRFAVADAAVAVGSLIAPMPAAVGRVAVVVGQPVAAGDVLFTLEAMKLEHAVLAPHAGIVTHLPVQPGHQVTAGSVLAVVTPHEIDDTQSNPEDTQSNPEGTQSNPRARAPRTQRAPTRR
jgi:propionyl-CoA carboxylase alpha chain